MNLQILLVEDDEDSRNALQRLLTKTGHSVLAVPTVPDAIAATDFVPQVVLLDLMLPITSGLALLPHLMAMNPVPRLAFISANIPPMIPDYHPTPVYFRKPLDFPVLANWLKDPSAGVPVATPSHT
jgi:two-component system response regulator HydG